MSAGRVILPSRNRKPANHTSETVPLTVVADRKLHERYRLIVLTKIGLREGDNTDVLEALGIIPTVTAPKPANSGRWPRKGVSA